VSHKKDRKTKKILEKPSKTAGTMNNEHRRVAVDSDKEVLGMYEAQEEQWSIYWLIKRHMKGLTIDKPSIKLRLQRLSHYVEKREGWYDAVDSKIVLRLPCRDTEKLSVDNYRSYFLSAVHANLSLSIRDAANHPSLSLWRYEKYMRDWALFKELERFLQPFQAKSSFIRLMILLRLDRLMEKLSVLITLCTIYICIEKHNDEVDVNDVQVIDMTNIKTKQLVFFDLRNRSLLTDLEVLEDNHSVTVVPPDTIPEEFDFL